MSAPDPPDAADAASPNELREKDPMKWSQDDVQTFLQHNKAEYFLDNDIIAVLQRERVAGRALLSLTEEQLVNYPYNIAGGAAASIEQLIKSLGTGRKFFFTYKYLMLIYNPLFAEARVQIHCDALHNTI